ncbi:MAG: hypothetical protein AAGU02_09375 [Lawsonibacter sp.]
MRKKDRIGPFPRRGWKKKLRGWDRFGDQRRIGSKRAGKSRKRLKKTEKPTMGWAKAERKRAHILNSFFMGKIFS